MVTTKTIYLYLWLFYELPHCSSKKICRTHNKAAVKKLIHFNILFQIKMHKWSNKCSFQDMYNFWIYFIFLSVFFLWLSVYKRWPDGPIIGSGSVVASCVINIAVLPMLVPLHFCCVDPVESVCFWLSEYRLAICGQLSTELKCSCTRNLSDAISCI